MVLVRPERHLNIIEPSPTPPPPMVPLCASVVREKVLYFRLLTISVFQYLSSFGASVWGRSTEDNTQGLLLA